jgi:hypothetical protein
MHFQRLVILPVCVGHSWLTLIGLDGLQRGGLNGTDLTRQRYYCPYSNFSLCTAASSNVTLPADSNRPCRQQVSNPMARVAAGSDLSIVWAGNGHTDQGFGSCVNVSITPFSIDPSISSFSPLVDCASFVNGSTPTTLAAIPKTYTPGNYTIFWVWDFAGFFYSSCADIVVTPPTVSPPLTYLTLSQALAMPYGIVNCAMVTDSAGYCQRAVSPRSYCISWSVDTCGRSHCHGLESNVTCAGSAGVTTLPPKGPYPNATELSLPYNITDCRTVTVPDAWCQAVVSVASYCKNWSEDNCGRAHCFGADVGLIKNCTSGAEVALQNVVVLPPPPVVVFKVQAGRGCESSSYPTGYCQQEYGPSSYCKLFMQDTCGRSVCQGQGSLLPCP